MAANVVWNDRPFFNAFEREVTRRISSASIYLKSQIQADISQSGTVRYGVKSRKGKVQQKTVYNVTHSVPGNPPYKQTGHLRRSIAWEVLRHPREGPVGRVGTNLRYGRYLELGTTRMKARPYLRRNLNLHIDTIRRIVTREIRPGELATLSNQFRSGVLGRGARRFGLR